MFATAMISAPAAPATSGASGMPVHSKTMAKLMTLPPEKRKQWLLLIQRMVSKRCWEVFFSGELTVGDLDELDRELDEKFRRCEVREAEQRLQEQMWDFQGIFGVWPSAV